MKADDVHEITSVINLYALAIDTLQIDLLDLVFTQDMSVDYMNGEWHDLATFKRDMTAIHAPLTTSQHFVSNHIIRVDGDRATALSYAFARLFRNVPEGGGDVWEVGAWYDDQFVRTLEGWRIKRRVLRGNWCGGNMRVPETLPAGQFRPEMTPLRVVARNGEVGIIEMLS